MSRIQYIPQPRQLSYHELPRFFRPKLRPADQLRAGKVPKFTPSKALKESLN